MRPDLTLRILLALILLAMVALAVEVGLFLHPTQQAITARWVSPTGSGSSCTQAAPCGTIKAAADGAASGDTVKVLPGNYALDPFSTYVAGVRFQCVDAAGAPAKWLCKLQPKNGVSNSATFWTIQGQSTTIDGFEFDGRTPNGSNAVRVGFYATPNGPGPVTFSNIHMHHVYWYPCAGGGAGLLSDAYSAANAVVHFYNNWVHHTGQGNCNQVHNIYMSAAGDVIGNLSHNSSGWNIQTWHDAGPNAIWYNTMFKGASGNMSVGNGDTYHGAKAWTGSIVNNISYDSPYGINVYGDIAAGQRIEKNIVNKNANNLNLKGQTCSGCIDQDPQFVNYDPNGNIGDYHLKEGSPGIDAATTSGQPSTTPATDMDGYARNAGGKADIGTYEYQSGTPVPPNPTPTGGNANIVFVPPASCGGLPSGAAYNSGGTVKVCP
jgi:hypothetical protein